MIVFLKERSNNIKVERKLEEEIVLKIMYLKRLDLLNIKNLQIRMVRKVSSLCSIFWRTQQKPKTYIIWAHKLTMTFNFTK